MKRSLDSASQTPIVLGLVGLSWLGLVLHNVAELGPSRLLGPETIGPTVVCLLLAAGLLTRMRRGVEWLLMGWALLQLVGGGFLSVLPLPLWPYDPEQSFGHYAVHALYALLQLPFLVLVTRHLRHQSRGTSVMPARAFNSSGYGRLRMLWERGPSHALVELVVSAGCHRAQRSSSRPRDGSYGLRSTASTACRSGKHPGVAVRG